jgi:glycosyltransferase involved in cell wall biosynthesis
VATSAPPAPAAPSVVSTTEKQRIVAVAADAAQLDECAKKLRGLSAFGHRVVLLWLHGEPGPRLSSFRARVPIRPPSQRPLRARVRHAASTAPHHWLRDRGTLLSALRLDPVASRTLASADAVIPVGAEAWQIVDHLTARRRPLVTAEELAGWEEVGAVWRKLQRRVDAGPARLDARYATRLLDHISLLGGQVPAVHQTMLVPLVEALHHGGEYDVAARLVPYLAPDAPGLDEVARALRRGLRALVETSAAGAEVPDLRRVAGEVVAAADLALGAGDTDRAVEAATLALQLLFHRELHADNLTSPLVEEPDVFLADWRASRVGQLLASPTPRRPALRRRGEQAAYLAPAEPGNARPRVVVTPGSYPQFAGPVIEALREKADVHVVELAARAGLRGLGTRRELVGARLRQALGEEAVPDYELLEELEHAGALFVDWADRGALAAVMSVPEGLRVVLRIHSMDALSPWVHLLDWSRVDDLVLVSEHLRVLVERLLGERLAGTRVHVVPNVLVPERLPTHKTEGHRRRLLMVGWAQRVKDPVWALEILGALRATDPSWRLSLVGADFPTGAVRSQRAYAREFWARLAQDDVRGAVDFVAFTRDLAPHLAASGFVLSTSRRESFGMGLVEGAASGAVPVVRDWPVFASLDGARGLFPDEWVVGTVEEAVARISSLEDERAWQEASQEARRVVHERFASGTSRATFQELVLGG